MLVHTGWSIESMNKYKHLPASNVHVWQSVKKISYSKINSRNIEGFPSWNAMRRFFNCWCLQYVGMVWYIYGPHVAQILIWNTAVPRQLNVIRDSFVKMTDFMDFFIHISVNKRFIKCLFAAHIATDIFIETWETLWILFT